MECACFEVIARRSRWGRGTILPDGVSDDVGIESSSVTWCRRGAFSKKSRSRVIKSCLGQQDLRWKVVRFARFFRGSCVMVPHRRNRRKDEKSPSKSALSRIRVWVQVRQMFNCSTRNMGIGIPDCTWPDIRIDDHGLYSVNMWSQ